MGAVQYQSDPNQKLEAKIEKGEIAKDAILSTYLPPADAYEDWVVRFKINPLNVDEKTFYDFSRAEERVFGSRKRAEEAKQTESLPLSDATLNNGQTVEIKFDDNLHQLSLLSLTQLSEISSPESLVNAWRQNIHNDTALACVDWITALRPSMFRSAINNNGKAIDITQIIEQRKEKSLQYFSGEQDFMQREQVVINHLLGIKTWGEASVVQKDGKVELQVKLDKNVPLRNVGNAEVLAAVTNVETFEKLSMASEKLMVPLSELKRSLTSAEEKRNAELEALSVPRASLKCSKQDDKRACLAMFGSFASVAAASLKYSYILGLSGHPIIGAGLLVLGVGATIASYAGLEELFKRH